MILALGIFAPKAHSFPEMVSHGYFSCTVCHVSPTGGGALTPYGRSLSLELMSTWGDEKSTELLHGAVKPPEWLMVGGDFRALQLYLNNPTKEKAEFFPMQADVEPVVQFDKWTVSATLGLTKQRGVKNAPIKFLSRRYYVRYQATDEISVRMGRFFPAYGLMTPDHIRVTRRGVGFDQGQETSNLEMVYLLESIEVIGTAIGKRYNEQNGIKEEGGALTIGLAVGQKSKVGASVFRTHQETIRRDLAGVWSILNTSEKTYFMNDWTVQELQQKTDQSKTQSFLFYNELGYEWKKGFVPYLIYERSQDLQRIVHDLTFEIFGGGLHLMPYPHFDLKLEYQNRTDKQPLATSHTAWLMLHYYL